MVKVKQDDTQPIAGEIIATELIEISEAMKKLNSSRLKRCAVIALVHDQSKISKTTIELVLNNLERLREDWCN